tara:strand:- start:131 stop:286 length:156 start_codon:yes stop_codon:yes gene_type:complete
MIAAGSGTGVGTVTGSVTANPSFIRLNNPELAGLIRQFIELCVPLSLQLRQ